MKVNHIMTRGTWLLPFVLLASFGCQTKKELYEALETTISSLQQQDYTAFQQLHIELAEPDIRFPLAFALASCEIRSLGSWSDQSMHHISVKKFTDEDGLFHTLQTGKYQLAFEYGSAQVELQLYDGRLRQFHISEIQTENLPATQDRFAITQVEVADTNYVPKQQLSSDEDFFVGIAACGLLNQKGTFQGRARLHVRDEQDHLLLTFEPISEQQHTSKVGELFTLFKVNIPNGVFARPSSQNLHSLALVVELEDMNTNRRIHHKKIVQVYSNTSLSQIHSSATKTTRARENNAGVFKRLSL